jgi:hypothetical protein
MYQHGGMFIAKALSHHGWSQKNVISEGTNTPLKHGGMFIAKALSHHG